MLSVDTAYGERQENSWSAATAWGIWQDKEDAPRAMLTDAWRGRPRLRGVPDSPNPSERMGLVERVHHLATKNRVDIVLIEQKTRGTDLYNELERALFANGRVWASDIKWAETVINEVASAPRGKYNDLCDTASAALLYLRDNNMLSLGEEFRREERRKLVFRGNKERGGMSIRERYET